MSICIKLQGILEWLNGYNIIYITHRGCLNKIPLYHRPKFAFLLIVSPPYLCEGASGTYSKLPILVRPSACWNPFYLVVCPTTQFLGYSLGTERQGVLSVTVTIGYCINLLGKWYKKLNPSMFSSSLYSFYEQFSPADAKLNNDNLLTLQAHSLKALETGREKV